MMETIWFILWGVLWAVYFMLDGFDLGLGALMPFLAREDSDKRMVYHSMGPFWDGNEVWLITAGGVTFAAFPMTYAVMFSSLYSALMLILFCLIVRAVSIEFRGKIQTRGWKSFWDACFFGSSALAAVLLGVAFANIFRGIPIDADGVFQGNLFTLLNPYALLGGVLFLLLFAVHGALWLAVKTQGNMSDRAFSAAKALWPVLLAIAVFFLTATAFATRLYDNYLVHPALLVIPLACVAGLLLTRVFLARKAALKAWSASSLTIVGATLFGVVGLYPDLLPSSLDPAWSKTAFNSSSSPLTLKIMLGVVLVFLPIVIVYQAWIYRVFGHKVTEKELAAEEVY